MSVVPKEEFAEPAITEILPAGGWGAVDVRELWRHRELVFFLVWRDVKVRYKQTALGAAWAVLQPAAMMVVFTVVLNRVAGLSSGSMPYPLFVYLGLTPWMLFSTVVGQAGNSVVNSEHLITKIFFPRLAIPFAAAGAALVDFAAACVLLAGMLVWYGVRPGWTVVFLPVVVGMIVLTALGVGTMLAAIHARYRDVRHVLPFVLQVWMLSTPTIYLASGSASGSAMSGKLHMWMMANPTTHLIEAFRACCTGGALNYPALAISGVGSVGVFVIGCLVFRRMERSFADII